MNIKRMLWFLMLFFAADISFVYGDLRGPGPVMVGGFFFVLFLCVGFLMLGAVYIIKNIIKKIRLAKEDKDKCVENNVNEDASI